MAESDPLHLVYLSGVDYAASGYQTATLRAIRHIREVLGSDSSLRPAKEAVDRFLTNPTVKLLVDASTDEEAVKRAVTEAVDYHQGAALFEINPTDLELPNPDEDPEGEDVPTDEAPAIDPAGPFSAAAYKTALALLSMEDGDPTKAFYRAALLGKTTDDLSLYQEVQYALMSVFPPLNPGITVIG
jgi:hypothetical protein